MVVNLGQPIDIKKIQEATNTAPKLSYLEIKDDESNDSKQKPFEFVHLHLIKGEQKAGKTATAVARVRDYVYCDCVKEYLKNEKGKDAVVPNVWENPNTLKGIVVLNYDRYNRIAKLQVNQVVKGQVKSIIKLIRIPKTYKLRSNLKVYSVIHIYNIPCQFAYCTWEQMLLGLKNGIIRDAWIILDQYELVGSARDGQSKVGKFLYKHNNQFAKRHLEVYIIAPSNREVDWTIRQMRNEDIECRRVIGTNYTELSIKKTGTSGVLKTSFDTSEYYRNYDADELIPAPSQQVLKDMGVFDD